MNTKNIINNNREISRISHYNTPQSTDNPSKVSIPFDQGNERCPKKANVDSKVDNKKSKKHKMKIPTCPSYKKLFVMEIQNMRSPVMTKNCKHTICFGCVQHFVEKNKTKQKHSYITVCNCPIDSCGAKRSFNCNTYNFNRIFP